MLIYHLTTRAQWRSARVVGIYRDDSLEDAGFIHCSTAAQLLPVANAFFAGVEAPVALEIDTERLAARLAWEAPVPDDLFSGELFPHVYGPINLDAVVALRPLERGSEGSDSSFQVLGPGLAGEV